jgi:SAM-dependent methyltransferase
MRTSLLLIALVAGASAAAAQQPQAPFQPTVGQAGKDVVWVPSPEVTVEKMLEVGKVTSQDFVMDLGSGDGRNVIAAAKRGARGVGVEYNPDMVGLSKRLAMEAGVAERAQFVEADMFTADISKADVMLLFLLPSNLLRLRDTLFNLRPGARIVLNTFGIQDWEPDETFMVDDCTQWCTVYLIIVPAKVAGSWRVGGDTLELKQEFQNVSGTLTSAGQSVPVTGKLRGTEITLKAGTREITGRVRGNEIDGNARNGSATSAWRATRSGS